MFSDKEKDAVVLVEHFATGPKSEMPAGNTSNVDAYPDADKVFLLSYEETMKYLPNPEDRQIKPTSYAILKKVYTKIDSHLAPYGETILKLAYVYLSSETEGIPGYSSVLSLSYRRA